MFLTSTVKNQKKKKTENREGGEGESLGASQAGWKGGHGAGTTGRCPPQPSRVQRPRQELVDQAVLKNAF